MDEGIIEKLRESIKNKTKIEKIYVIDDNMVAKESRNEESAYNDYWWGRFLKSLDGVNVPEMHLLVPPDKPLHIHQTRLLNWYIIMERINGVHINRISGDYRKDAFEQRRKQLGVVLELGVFTIDALMPENALYDTSNRKLYLIDFEFWRSGTPEEIEKIYRHLRTVIG